MNVQKPIIRTGNKLSHNKQHNLIYLIAQFYKLSTNFSLSELQLNNVGVHILLLIIILSNYFH